MKIKNMTDEDILLRGVVFPAGKSVTVEDQGLIAKCLAMPQFQEVKARGKNKA